MISLDQFLRMSAEILPEAAPAPAAPAPAPAAAAVPAPAQTVYGDTGVVCEGPNDEDLECGVKPGPRTLTTLSSHSLSLGLAQLWLCDGTMGVAPHRATG